MDLKLHNIEQNEICGLVANAFIYICTSYLYFLNKGIDDKYL